MSDDTTIYPLGAWVDLEESQETTVKPFGPWFEPEEEEEPVTAKTPWHLMIQCG